MRFPGQRYDSASGLNYNYLRDGYEPGTGRYSQSDPLGLLADISTYSYVKGNPLRWTDRLGLEVDINLFDTGIFGLFGDKLYERAQRVENRPGEISIGGHGLPGEVHGRDGEPLKLEDLAEMIRQTEKWKNGIRRVRLYVCDSGKGQMRHQLAKMLGAGTTILGASALVWYSPVRSEPTIFGGKNQNGNLVADPTKPGFWNWTTTDKGYGSCENGCY